MRSCVLPSVALATTLLAGCAGHGMHHHHGPGTMQQTMDRASASATPPATVTASMTTLSSGYQKVAAAPGTRLYFVNLRDGQTVSNPVKLVFGLSGMGVAPAGVEKAGTGHHHLLIDVAAWDANAPLPVSDQVRHFGMGQTETTLQLAPGTHTLQLVLGDQNHIPHHPVVASERITVTVK